MESRSNGNAPLRGARETTVNAFGEEHHQANEQPDEDDRGVVTGSQTAREHASTPLRQGFNI